MLNKYTRSSYNDKIEIETPRQISKKHDYFCQEAIKLATIEKNINLFFILLKS